MFTFLFLCLSLAHGATIILFTTYAGTGCSGGVSGSVTYNLGCNVAPSAPSYFVSVSGTAVTFAEHTASDCSDTGTNSQTYTNVLCGGVGGDIVVTISTDIGSFFPVNRQGYSDSACTTPSVSVPYPYPFAPLICKPQAGGTSTMDACEAGYFIQNTFPTADCTGTSTPSATLGLATGVCTDLGGGVYVMGGFPEVCLAAAVTGAVVGDPITEYRGRKVEFVLPDAWTTLVQSPRMKVQAKPFPGESGDEQWIGQIRIIDARGKQLLEVGIKSDLALFNRSLLPEGAFETVDVKLGPNREPLLLMPQGHYALAKKIDLLFARHRWAGETTVGAAPRREMILLVDPWMHVAITSTSALEWYGDPGLAAKHAHLDMYFPQLPNPLALKGLLPELWALQPLSEASKAMIKDRSSKATMKIDDSPRTMMDDSPRTMEKGVAQFQSKCPDSDCRANME